MDTQQLDARFLGREFDEAFLADLPAGADPCGENGEFHSFVYAGPMLNQEIPVLLGGDRGARSIRVRGYDASRPCCYPFVPIALTKMYCKCSPDASGPVIAAVADSGY